VARPARRLCPCIYPQQWSGQSRESE
jgi:hypothetical protein